MKKQLVALFGNDRSIKYEYVPENKLNEWELAHRKEQWYNNSIPPTTDRRTKKFKQWYQNMLMLQYRIKMLENAG